MVRTPGSGCWTLPISWGYHNARSGGSTSAPRVLYIYISLVLHINTILTHDYVNIEDQWIFWVGVVATVTVMALTIYYLRF